MIGKIEKEVEEYLHNELLFGYYYNWKTYEENGDLYCEADCSPEVFRKAYGRSVCAKKSDEEGKLYVTAEEASDPVLLPYLQGIYRGKTYQVLPDTEAYGYMLVKEKTDEEEAQSEEKVYFQMSGDPEVLKQELHVRYYEYSFRKAQDGYFGEVKDCDSLVLGKILHRAACMEKTKETGLFHVTYDEVGKGSERAILRWKYHVKEFYFTPPQSRWWDWP